MSNERMTEAEVAALFGRAAPEPPVRISKAAIARDELDALDDKLRRHVEKNRLPSDRSYESAFARQMAESPALYAGYQSEIDRIKEKHGIGAENLSRPVGQ